MNHRTWWVVSCAISLVALVILAVVWYWEVNAYEPNPHEVTTQAEVDAEIKEHLTEEEIEDRHIIPTGVFLQSFVFLNSNDIHVSGYVWQKYPKDYPEEAERGVLFPEQISDLSPNTKEAYRKELEDGSELIGWYFDIDLRQNFTYSKYPLDTHNLWIRLWHADFNHKAILVPDLEAYAATGKQDTFGLDQEIVTQGWDLKETYYSYKPIDYDHTFGYEAYDPAVSSSLELHFNLAVHRKFRDAFIVELVPLFVVAALLFGVVMMITNDEAKVSKFGLDTSGAIGTCSALFFVVMLAHIRIREFFPGEGIVYMEFFYLTTYMFILLVALNSYLFSYGNSVGPDIIHYKDNIVVKIAFWPVYLSIMAVLTVMRF